MNQESGASAKAPIQPMPSNLTIDLNPNVRVYGYSDELGAVEFSPGPIKRVHIFTPLEVTGKVRSPELEYEATYTCEVNAEIDDNFSASSYPKQVSNDLQGIINREAADASSVCETNLMAREWTATRFVPHKVITLRLNFTYR